MADQKKRISELPSSGTTTNGLYTIGVNASNESVKVPLGEILAGYDQGAQDAADALEAATTAASNAANALTVANRAEGKADTALTDAASAASAAQNAASAAAAADSKAVAAQTTATAAASAAADNVVDEVSATAGESTVAVSVKQHGHTAVVGTIPAATASVAGAMTAADKAKLERHETVLAAAGKYDDTLEFAGILETATVNQSTSSKYSTDSDAQVFFVADIKRFVLGVRTDTTYNAPQQLQAQGVGERATIGNIAAYERLTDVQVAVLSQDMSVFANYYTFYADWADRDLFATDSLVPLAGKSFICTSTDVLYYYKSSTAALQPMGKDYTSEIANLQSGVANLQSSVAPRLFFNGNSLTNREGQNTSLAQFVVLTADNDEFAHVRKQGVVVALITEDGLKTYQWKGTTWGDVNDWKDFGGSATVGNCYNVTNEVPKTGYYDLQGAINATFAKGVAAVGMQITFAIAEGSWKTYQYVGEDTESNNFTNTANWLDLAGMSAGSEPVLNVNALCGNPIGGGYYVLGSARNAIAQLCNDTGIEYRKPGLVITYMVGDTQWETKQFNGSSITDFNKDDEGLWTDFGGAGANVETKDVPANGGTDAFSTGGAYTHTPADLRVDDSSEGVVKLALLNAGGNVVGNEVQFSVGTGSGESTGTLVTFVAKNSPFYAKAGGTVTLEACVRSITKRADGTVLSNDIEKVELYDRDTNQLLQTFAFANGKASSADDNTYDFDFDLSSYFTQAASRKFRFVAYDNNSPSNSGSRNVNVTAVDVTIVSDQPTIAYSATNTLTVGGSAKMLPMYLFPNNRGEQGIRAIIEIYLNGQWQTLGEEIALNSFSKSVSINPNNCLGSVLTHGAYRLRIHGVDVASGVVGNYLYTTVMVVDPTNTTPIVATRYYTETLAAKVRQYENITVDYAAYCASANEVQVQVYKHTNGTSELVQTTTAARSSMYTFTTRVVGVATNETVTLGVSFTATVSGVSATSPTASYLVSGSLVNIEPVLTQLVFDKEFGGRSNADSKTATQRGGYIVDTTGGCNLELFGCNFSTNGFVKDSFGTSQYNTEGDTGLMALRIAENVTGELDYKPFNVAGIEQNGMAVQFRIRTKHIADETARLISCISGGIGFFVQGKRVVFTTNNAPELNTSRTDLYTIAAALQEDSITDVAIVVEPTSQAPFAGVGMVKMYFDGELIGACIYNAGAFQRHATPITFDGTSGDLYVYNIRAWETYYGFQESFYNYLLKLADSGTMITEYDFNRVMASQAAEGNPATSRPQARSGEGYTGLYETNIPYFVVCKNATTADTFENYPEYLETLDGDKKTPCLLDVYAYFPQRPWQNFKAIGVTVTNQGTTSSQRPIKNIKMKFAAATITLLTSRSDYSGEAQAKYDLCAANAANHRVQVYDTSLPTNIITVKVDYSESGGANNGASTHLFNDLQRLLGDNYITPAQKAYNGDFELNTSIDSIPCAFFRTDRYSADPTSPSNAYFHAKGNWNFDKGDPAVFGFEGVDGYNADCLNYGEFVELIAARDQSLANFAASIDKSGWETDTIYVLSEFCGAGHKIFQYVAGAWVENTGTMTYSGGRWRVDGLVVNPVENYEIKTYDALAWFQGVKTVDDMLALDSKGKPIWLTYFESRYPDNKALNTAYEDGRKVPYRLFQWLQWCEQCNQNNTAADGDITIDGTTVAGTPANRLKKFERELHKVANVHSMICYHVFTDYIAAVDQRSKNMMIGFYLETDGTVRMYLNHLYDGDTILGSDNDCGLTIPAELDPNNDPNGYYQGHDSVLFTQLANASHIWLADYTSDDDVSDSTKTTTVAAIAKEMREKTNATGLRMFSPDGIEYYWVTLRLSKYPKLVSSFDGIRKYIEHSTAAKNYVYALHGLSIQRLRDYVATRFRFRDGYYGCGDNLKSHIDMRCVGVNMSVTIKAAKSGYFALGVDRTTAEDLRETVYLEAGQSATLHSGSTNRGGGIMLYVYGADRIAELDLRNAAPKQESWSLEGATLLRKLVIGGESYSVPTTTEGNDIEGLLSTLALGEMPFLEEVDARNFPLATINAQHCPRLKKVYATGTRLTDFTPAETSPLDTLQLPATIAALAFVNLPNLTYPNGGLTIAGYSNVTKLQVAGCPNIDAVTMLQNAINGDASITAIGITGLDVTADVSVLQSLMQNGAKGIDSDLEEGCDGLKGRWISATYIGDELLGELRNYFQYPNSLAVHNAQFTAVVFNDAMDDPKNITNLDNNTTGTAYTPSGHVVKIREKLIPVKGKVVNGVFVGQRLSDSNYRQLYDGTDFAYTDLDGGWDVFMRCPALWYKGVNDFANDRKYIFWSSLANEPLSTCKSQPIRRQLSAFAAANVVEGKALYIDQVTIGESTLDSEGVLGDMASHNTYKMDVEGMKQVRYPGLNNASIGAAFLDENGVIISTFNMVKGASDFIVGDYLFTAVPSGAKTFVFTSHTNCASLEAIAVDSDQPEAIEPDWVYNAPWLGGVYHASVDGAVQLRSVSSQAIRVGRVSSNSKTSTDWAYDADGNPTNTPATTMDYTFKDFQNLARRRGAGYQLFDYEMSKLMAILWYSLTGNRNVQAVCGNGKGSGGSTGYRDTIGNADSVYGVGDGVKCLGFEGFYASTYEWMDNVAVNVASYASAYLNKMVEYTTDPVNAVWHIYDPIAQTERTVQGITDNLNIARVRHGRYCDIIASKCIGDSSFQTYYCDQNYYSGSRCRVVGRAYNSSGANGGLAYAYANNASASAYTSYGSRLAFRGTINIEDEQ